MKSIKLTALCCLLLSAGCSVRTSLLVDIENEEHPLMGEAVATLFSGTFEVSNLDGLLCNGTYNQYTTTRNLKTSVKCSDGRHGEVTLLRTGANLENGSGVGVLNDGSKFRILMGDMVHYRNSQGVWDKADFEK